MFVRASQGGGSGGLDIDKNHYFWNYSDDVIQFTDSIEINTGAYGCLIFDIRERNYVTLNASSTQKVATKKDGTFLSINNNTKTDIRNYDWLTIYRSTNTGANFTLTFSDT